jgi:hydrogenase maturation protease
VHLVRDPLPEADGRALLTVVGVGNAWRGDDAAGLAVAARLRSIAGTAIEVTEYEGEPTGLVDIWAGADALWLVDAVSTGEQAGTLRRLDASDRELPAGLFRASSTHHVGLDEAVALARAVGRLPPRVVLVGVEGVSFDAGGELTPAVAEACGRAAEVVRGELIAARIESELRRAGTPERAEQERRYLKSELAHYGATVPALRRIAKAALVEAGGAGHEALLAAVEALWATAVHDCRAAAVELLELCPDALGPDDLDLLERLLRESRTWALVDNLAASVAGPLVERHAGLARRLDRWAADGDFWLRRSALLALLGPLRRGEGDFERFGRYADAMLEEREFFVRKAIGWVLRETAKRRPDLVYGWLRPRAARASGVTLREAVRYLPPEQRDELLQPRRVNARRASGAGP